MPLWTKRNKFTQIDMAYLGGLSLGCVFGTAILCTIAGHYLGCYLTGNTYDWNTPTSLMVNGKRVDQLARFGLDFGFILGVVFCFVAIKLIYTDEVAKMIFGALNRSRISKKSDSEQG